MRRATDGFSLIELMVALVVLAILLALAAPSYGLWLSNMRIRTAAQALQSGLQLARGEAVRRNALIRFQLTSTLDDDCVLSTSASNWVVSYDDPAGACAAPTLNESFAVNDPLNNPAPRMIELRPAGEGSRTVVVAAGQPVITFNGFGRVSNAAASLVQIDVTNPPAGSCVAAAGKLRCLRVTITAGGQVRICDPALAIAGNDPQRCTVAG